MRTIERSDIEAVWDRQSDLDNAAGQALAKGFIEEQPAVGVYLLACMEQVEGDPEESDLWTLALAIWDVMRRAHGGVLPPLTPEAIDQAETTNIESLGAFDDLREYEAGDKVREFFFNYRQQPLLGFCLEVLMEGNEDTPELSRESLGLELLWLKTLIDGFDQLPGQPGAAE